MGTRVLLPVGGEPGRHGYCCPTDSSLKTSLISPLRERPGGGLYAFVLSITLLFGVE